jgi:ribonuclease BN (tRNA processing enzyme)
VTRIDLVLTHFHLDHVCGLMYTPALPVVPDVWAPGAWLYDTPSERILEPLRTAPMSPFPPRGTVHELGEAQRIGAFDVAARAQPRHSAPTAGLRIGDRLALLTDTAYDPGSAPFVRGVAHLLHEAWNVAGDNEDAGARDALRVAAEAGVERLTFTHLDPRGDDAALAEHGTLGRDGMEI